MIRVVDLVTEDIEALRKEYEKMFNATDINFVFEDIQEDDNKSRIDNESIGSKTTLENSYSTRLKIQRTEHGRYITRNYILVIYVLKRRIGIELEADYEDIRLAFNLPLV